MSDPAVHRIEVRPRSDHADPRSGAALAEASSSGVQPSPDRIDAAQIYLIEGAISASDVQRLIDQLFADPVTETAHVGAQPATGTALVEVHPLPGVMDPDADAVELAIRTILGTDVRVRTGRRYDFHGVGPAIARQITERALANPVIHRIHDTSYHPPRFPVAASHSKDSVEIPLRDLSDDALTRLSRDAHLFLSLPEMQAIREKYRTMGREPREIELETLAQTWSEHCVHKTLKSTVRFHGSLPGVEGRKGHEVHPDGSVTIRNLLASTIAAATHELMEDGIDWCLSVFVDNAGIIAFDDAHAVCFKVETHNHPSAIEPYGGAATGIGGCIRDILGTGLAARPIAATDVFCVAPPDRFVRSDEAAAQRNDERLVLPAGCLAPRRILRQVVAGVRDYGNRMGIPTLNGAVWFDDDYVGNPLVFCGCVGIMPRDRIAGDAVPGDLIVALGGRTGRDGIHGATFSSAELTDTHADEFSHAVQIGNPVTQKKMLDAILAARDAVDDSGERICLYRAITDCGAGGFSSAVGEMGEKIGADVDLAHAPLKYDGLSPTEIWISEAQERMVLAVPPEHFAALRAICAEHDVECCRLGVFGTAPAQSPDGHGDGSAAEHPGDSANMGDGTDGDGPMLVLRYDRREVGRLGMAFLHDGIPPVKRDARWSRPEHHIRASRPTPHDQALLELLAHPNIASKHWIIRQYDHEVQGRTAVKPLVGPGEGPGDAAVIRPVAGSRRALAIGCGLATGLRDDPRLMAHAAVDECVRNLVCVGADPDRIAILDNFCWPGCQDEARMGALVLAAEGCYDAAMAFRTPFISGKDSLNNQFVTDDGRTIRIPPTLLISGFGIVPNVQRCVTMDLKEAGNLLLIVGITTGALGGSHYEMCFGSDDTEHLLPAVDLVLAPRLARGVSRLIQHGLVRSAHDLSEGGLLLAAAEMAFAGGVGAHLDTFQLPVDGEISPIAELFGEAPSRYLLEVPRAALDEVDALLESLPYAVVGETIEQSRLLVPGAEINLELHDLRAAWRGTLDW